MAVQSLEHGDHRCSLYIAGATHIRDFCQPLGVTAYKIGITGTRDAQARVEDLRRKRYGGLLLPCGADGLGPPTAAVTEPPLASSDEWFLAPLNENWLTDVMMPAGIALRDKTLELSLPSGVRTEDADRALHALLQPRSLRAYLATVDGQARKIAAGYDPGGWLCTAYDLMTEERRVSPVQEIYLFRPRRELSTLVAVLGPMLDGLKTRSA